MTAPDTKSEPVFCEPWEAQAFALANALIDTGVFTADEWANTLGRRSSVPRPPEIRTRARPITTIGWRRWNVCVRKKVWP